MQYLLSYLYYAIRMSREKKKCLGRNFYDYFFVQTLYNIQMFYRYNMIMYKGKQFFFFLNNLFLYTQSLLQILLYFYLTGWCDMRLYIRTYIWYKYRQTLLLKFMFLHNFFSAFFYYHFFNRLVGFLQFFFMNSSNRHTHNINNT